MNTIRVDVVSAEESIFSGEARFVALPGEAGELGIYPRHTPLISRIKAGSVRIEKTDGTEEFVFVAGVFWKCNPTMSPCCQTLPFAVKTWTKKKPMPLKLQPKMHFAMPRLKSTWRVRKVSWLCLQRNWQPCASFALKNKMWALNTLTSFLKPGARRVFC